MLTKRIKLNFAFKLSYLNSNFELPLGYLNPALNNLAQQVGKSTMAFIIKQASHGPYSNPGKQVGALSKDFGAVSQTDLVRV